MVLTNNRAALYARFSSDNQRTESIDAQLRAMRTYCEQHHIIIVDTYVDEAKSATTDRRPAFQKMISDSAAHIFNILLVHKLDRFARNRYDSAIYKRELKKNGVTVYSVLENLDNSPESIIMESVLEGMSEYYSQNLAREVMKGMKETALQCKHTGGKPPLGYDVDPASRKLIVNETEAEAVRLIYQMYSEGCGYMEILHTLHERHMLTKSGKEFQKNSLHSILTNPKYAGIFVFNRSSAKAPDGTRNSHRHKTPENIISVEGGCPQIVETEIYHKVEERMRAHKHEGGRINAKQNYLLSGKVFCKECGRAMVGNARRSGRDRSLYITYRCPSQKHTCTNREINRDYLERYVVELLEEEIFSPSAMRSLAEKIRERQQESDTGMTERRAEAEQRLSAVMAELQHIADAIGQGLLSSVLAERLSALEAERAKLEVTIAQMEEKSMERGDIDPTLIPSRYKEIRYSPASPEYKAFIREFISRIVIGRYVVTIGIRTGLGKIDSLDTTLSVRRREIYEA